MLAFRNEAFIKQAAVLCRLMGQRQLPSSNSGALTQSSTRHYRSKPTHGIGRYKHLLPPEAPPKKKEKPTSKEIKASSDSAYGTVNLEVSGYDMTLVEHYSQYVHNLCNRLSIKVEESYAKPTITKEVLLLQEQGTKMFVDAVLTTHERVIQVQPSSFSARKLTVLDDRGQQDSQKLLFRDRIHHYFARPDIGKWIKCDVGSHPHGSAYDEPAGSGAARG